eukprot:1238206-Alexandrium_andersonii.AAC.1
MIAHMRLSPSMLGIRVSWTHSCVYVLPVGMPLCVCRLRRVCKLFQAHGPGYVFCLAGACLRMWALAPSPTI